MSLKTIAAIAAAGLTLFVLNCAAPPSGVRSDDANVDGTDPATGKVSQATNGLPCNVNDLLGTRCLACHGDEPAAGASTSFTSWDALQKAHDGKRVIDLVKERLHDTARPMPPSPRLAEDELATFDAWLKAPKESSESCDAPEAPKTEPLECDGDRVNLKAGEPFVMQDGGEMDQYVCFGVEVTHDTKRHLTAFGPKVDNPQILHHILVFQAEEKDAIGPKPEPCNPLKSAGWTMIGGWAPGGESKVMPPEAGFPEPAGTTHYVVQLHYNNARGLTGAKDNSGMEICSTDKLRPNDAGVVAFGAINLGPKKPINIPPRKAVHKVSCNYKWRDEGVTFFSASPHMHKLGRALRSETTSGRVLADQEQFDFEQQVGAEINTTIAKGETVKTTCTWSNPTDKSVTFGEGTDDEMCFNFLAYYPKIDGLAWVMPSVLSLCDIEE